MINKKGELTSQQVILLVLVIASFLIALFFFYNIVSDDYSEEELCKLSVLGRASTSSSIKGNIPLKCTTEKICLTSESGGECEQFAGEEKVMKVELPKNDPQEVADIIEKVYAESLYSCWKAMGEGRLDLFGSSEIYTSFLPGALSSTLDFFKGKDVQPTCVICNRIAIDEDFIYEDKKNKGSGLKGYFVQSSTKVDIHDYIEKNGPGGSLSYLQVFTDKQITKYPQEFLDKFGKENPNGGVIDEVGIIFIQIINKGDPFQKNSWGQSLSAVGANGALIGGLIVVGAFVVNPVGSVIGLVGILKTAVAVGGTTAILSAFKDSQQNAISAGYCGQLNSPKAKQVDEGVYGCSFVRPFDYDNINEINQVCKNLEGNP